MFSSSDNEMKLVQTTVTEKTLANIAANGLLPSAQLAAQKVGYLSSADCGTDPDNGSQSQLMSAMNSLTKTSGSDLCINEMSFALIPEQFLGLMIKDLMNHPAVGAWCVVLEREYKLEFGTDSKALKAEFSERLRNSVLFLLKPQKGGFEKPRFPDGGKVSRFSERRLDTGISSDQILAILVPEHLKNLVENFFPNITVRVVSFKTEKVVFPVYETLKYWPERSGQDVKVSMEVPDFDGELKKFVVSQGISEIACHVLRLPTLKDTQYKVDKGVKHFASCNSMSNMPFSYFLYFDALIKLRMKTTKPKEQVSAEVPVDLQRQETKSHLVTVLQSAARGYLERSKFLPYLQLHKKVVKQVESHQIEQSEEDLKKLVALKKELLKIV